MTSQKAVLKITGSHLTVSKIKKFVANATATVEVSPKALRDSAIAYAFTHERAAKEVIYGVNTGFGPMAGYLVGEKQLTELQYNLIRSHAVGMGEPLPQEYVLAAMLVRLNTLVKGYSGVSRELIDQLTSFINHRIIPIVPDHGAVGTSGDLVQLAHIALGLIGEGEAYYKNVRQPAKAILRKVKLKPHQLQPKEGLSLINGTAMMTGIGSLLCADAEQLVSMAIRSGAFALETMHAFTDGISERLHSVRPHPGQISVASKLRKILHSSKLLRTRQKTMKKIFLNGDVQRLPEVVQEVYSLRCIPQILGPVHDAIETTRKRLEIEMNSVTDNPIVDVQMKKFIHGGNFHGDYIASAVDQMKIAIVKLTMLAERRINFFLNENVNKTFPPFLNLVKPGLTLGLQGLQFVATSTTARSQTLAFPQYIHSIPTNGDNQDIVSMGTDAALIAKQVIDQAFIVSAIELVTLSQAADCAPATASRLSNSSKELIRRVRQHVPSIRQDLSISELLNTFAETLRKD